jgi:diaminohydroxyphosphoribosylaminopyrimidine deaminase / 5-amino-6-(5-phosphoribosylamino)uracil reductase
MAPGSEVSVAASASENVTSREDSSLYMRRALRLAELGWGRVAPNPLVGAVVVRDGEVVGEGYHAAYGLAHAEVEALTRAGDHARGATLYVTLEPCSHVGKTPPCTEAILAAGICRVVYACADPDPQAGGGAELLRSAGVEVVGGVENAAATELNASFLFAHDEAGSVRPWLALKLALSLDARIADAEGRSAWLTGDSARSFVHHLRAGFDAIAVGIGTALADDPRLTVRGDTVPRRPPVRVVFDRLLRLPVDGYLVRTASQWPVWVVGGPATTCVDAARGLEERGVRVIRAEDLAGGLRSLRELGIRSILCEGGAGIARALLELGAVDRMHLFYAPLLLGGGARDAFDALGAQPLETTRRWRRLETRTFGADTLITVAI